MVRFVDYASLSATAPANHPRLIDITTYSISEEDHDYCNGYASTFNMWDAVVTLLHTISPATLDSFLDDSANEFKVILSWTGQPNKLLIWRKGTEILTGEFQDHPTYAGGVYEWDNVVRCKMDDAGAWNVTYASFGFYTKRDWVAVWDGDFTRDPLPKRGAVFTDKEHRNHIQVTIARVIMGVCPWPANMFTWAVSTA